MRKHNTYFVLSGLLGYVALAGCPNPVPIPPTNQQRYGAVAVSKAEVDAAPKPLIFSSSSTGTSLPSSVDLSGDGFLPTVGDQLQLGSCTAWATGYGLATYEVNRALASTPTSVNQMASPMDLYTKLINEARGSCGDGTDPRKAMGILARSGVASLGEVPYSTSCSAASSSRSFTLNDSQTISPSDTDVIKSLLNDHHPVAIGMKVYNDIQRFSGSGIYNPSPSSGFAGYHALLIIGYDDSRSAWRIMNSWGSSWGDNGMCWLSYAAFQRDANVCVASQSGADPTPTPTPGPASFSAFDSLQYQSISTGYYYIVHPFTLSRPVYVYRAALTYDVSGATTGWITINQWASTNYFWWSSYYPFPAGSYSASIQGVTEDGTQVNITAHQAIHAGGYVRGPEEGPQAVEAPQSVRDLIRSLAGRSQSGTTSLNRGDSVVVNGHLVTLR